MKGKSFIEKKFFTLSQETVFSTIGSYDKIDVELNKNSKIKKTLKFTYDRKEERLLFNNGKISTKRKNLIYAYNYLPQNSSISRFFTKLPKGTHLFKNSVLTFYDDKNFEITDTLVDKNKYFIIRGKGKNEETIKISDFALTQIFAITFKIDKIY